MRHANQAIALLILVCLCGAAPLYAANVIQDVRVDHPTVNPSSGAVVTVSMRFARAGSATIAVLDRDGYVVRELIDGVHVNGAFSVGWDGRDTGGEVVPDEAYSFKIDWIAGAQHETYFPADRPQPMLTIPVGYYDRRGATLTYKLPSACRVHLQAGTAVFEQNGGAATGPVLKTIVNREPRAAGAIAEHWNGFDESKTIFVPDLPHFVVGIAATPLPENSVIAIGNRQRSFVDSVSRRAGTSLLTGRTSTHEHHARIETLDDISPALRLEVLNGRWIPDEKIWVVDRPELRLRATPEGPTASRFAQQPGTVYRFINDIPAGSVEAGAPEIVVPLAGLRPGINRVTVNWSSKYGPLAANTVRIRLEAPAESRERKGTSR